MSPACPSRRTRTCTCTWWIVGAVLALASLAALPAASAAPRWLPKTPRDAMTKEHFNGKVKVSRARTGRDGKSLSADAAMEKIFGRVPTDKEIAGLVGAPDGAKIRVRAVTAEERFAESKDGHGVRIDVRHPYYVGKHEHTIFGRPGNVNARLDSIIINQDRSIAPRGLGARVTAHMVKTSRRMGLKAIYLTAARDDSGKVDLVGAMVWPKLGFDFRLDNATLQYRMQEEPAWRDYWQKRGWTQNMKLSLRSDSRSLWVHNQYMLDHDIHVDVAEAYGVK